jgi:predicted nucleotidyltransferase component of viral defense system
LSHSRHTDRIVLKGAMLLTTWLPHTSRGTRDLDLLAFGESSEDRVLGIFRNIVTIDANDGVVFDPASLQASRIREELDYGGLRLRGTAELGGARIAIVIDIAFGDSVEPGLETIDYPVLLDQPSPKLRAYAPETVIAEKFQAMVALGRANSRMKDFYDVWALSKTFTFDPERLSRAIRATFARRNTMVPTEKPDALTEAFAADTSKQRQWAAFVTDIIDAPRELRQVIVDIGPFLMRAANQART